MNYLFKTLVTSSVLVTSLFVSAADRNPRDVSETVIRNAQRTLELITREADYMTRRQIDLVNVKLNEIRDIVRNSGNPYPGEPNPPPYYPPRPQPQLINVRGSIETTDFSFDTRDLQGLFQQCSTFVTSRGMTQVDDIKVTVNFSPIQTLRNSQSFWKGATEICMQIVEVARRSGLRSSYDGRDVVFGTIETSEFSFSGQGKADLFRQCEQFVNSRGLTRVDDIKTVTNLNPIRELNNSESFWTGAVEICSQVLRDVR